MNIKTITYDADQWQLVPKELTAEMIKAGLTNYAHCNIDKFYNQLLAAAPQPEELEAQQPASVPDEKSELAVNSAYAKGWNDCRAAMLKGAK